MKALIPRIIALAAQLGLFFVVSAEAASVATRMQVSVNVPPHLVYEVTRQDAVIVITGMDVRQGYKEVLAGTALAVTTNNPAGYALYVSSSEIYGAEEESGKSRAVLSSITLSVNGGSYEMRPGGGVQVMMPFAGLGAQEVVFSYRFSLAPGAMPGAYPWPISVTASP